MFRVAAVLSLLALGHCLVLEAQQPSLDNKKILDSWKTLKTYKAKPVCKANKQQFQVHDASGTMNLIQARRPCAAMGAKYPTLVAKNEAARDAYEAHVCNAPARFHPIADVDTQVLALNEGCFQGSVMTAKKAWNKTHTVHLSEIREDHASALLQDADVNTVDADVLVVPSAADFAYQKVLMDFVPQAYSTFDYAKSNNLKFLVRSKMQKQLLKTLGVPEHHILNEVGKKGAICAAKGRKMHFVRMGGSSPRQLNSRIGSQIAETVLKVAKQQANDKPAVVFARSCGAKGAALENEEQALARIKSVMKELGRDEELVSFCPDEKSFVDLVALMKRAKLVTGAHGGALANLLFAKASCDTHVIEFVGDALTNKEKAAPYESYYHGGAGAPFSYKLVLMKKSEEDAKKLLVELDDFELALRQVWVNNHNEI